MSIVLRASGRSIFTASSVVLMGTLLAGCAGDSGMGGGLFQTGAVTQAVAPAPIAAPASRVDPACVTLSQQIDGLRQAGVATKVENAAAKKYKLTAADIVKADQLNKANADFKAKCGPQLPAAAAPGQGSVVPAVAAPAAAAVKAAVPEKAKAKAVVATSGVTAAPPKQ